MNHIHIRLLRTLRLTGVCLATVTSGCADGPVPELRSLNPWVRAQWSEDERETTTYHRKVADLAALRSQAATLPPAEQEYIAGQLSERLKEERSPVLRVELIRTLGEFTTPIAQSAVASSLADEAASVRIAACKALGRGPDAAGFQALSQTVQKDTDVDVRVAAARELGNFREYEAPQALRPVLDDRNPALQLAAMESLETLTGNSQYRRSVGTWREFLDGGNPAPPPPPTLAEMIKHYWNWY